MSNELMDFTARDNFNFFKYRYAPSEERRKSFMGKCERVLEYAHATVQDMCLLGYNLSELKEGGEWKEVQAPQTGNAFRYLSFEAFCGYAFGFSETRTKNLVGLAQFVRISGTKTGFIDERYQDFNTSALIELSSVPSGQRHYFTSDMTIKEIRTVKEYLNNGDYWADKSNPDFDVKTYAQAYKEAKEAKKAEKKAEKVTPALSLDIIPGQISLEDMEEVQEQEPEQGAPAPAKSDVGFSDDRFSPPSAWLQYHPEDEDDGLDEARYDDREDLSEPEPIEAEEEMTDEVSRETEDEPSRYSFHNRDAIRAFFRDYRTWEKNYATFSGMEAFEYKLKNGVVIIAVETTTCKDIANLTAERTVVRYFWRERRDGELYTYEVGTHELELYIKEIKDEL